MALYHCVLIWIGVFAALCADLGLACAEGVVTSAETFLARAEATWQALPPYAVDVTTTLTEEEQALLPGAGFAGKIFVPSGVSVSQGRLLVDGERLDWSCRVAQPGWGQPSPTESIRQIWDGAHYWRICEPVGAAGWCPERAMANNPAMRAVVIRDPASGLFLQGRLELFGGVNWIELARQASAVELLPDPEPIGAFSCRRLRLRVSGGRIDVWVDEACGYHLRDLVINLDRPANTPTLQRLVLRLKGGTGRVKTRIEIKDVRIERQGDWWFPVAGTVVTRIKAADGITSRNKVKTVWTNLIPHPDFVALAGFAPVLAEGTRLTEEGQPNPLVWRQGRVEPYLDPRLLTRLNGVMGDILGERSVGKTRHAAWLPATAPVLEDPSTWAPARDERSASGFACYDPVAMRESVLALYVATRLAGRSVPLAALIKPEYLAHPTEGSTPAQMLRITHDLGLPAQALTGLSHCDLQACPAPLLLRMRGSADSPKAHIYELYMGELDGQAWLYDARHPPRLEPYAVLRARWDGSALLLPTANGPAAGWPRPGWPRRMMAGGLFIAAVGAGCWLNRRSREWRWINRRSAPGRMGLESGLLLIVAVAGGVAWNLWREGGLLHEPEAAAVVRQVRSGHFIPHVPVETVAEAVQSKGDALLIDAREARAYAAGHIPCAISVPVDRPEDEWRQALAGVDRNARIIIYCASSTCHKADSLAARLANDGFRRLELFREGWAGWLAWRSR